MMLFFEPNFDGLIYFLALILLGPPILLAIIGAILRKNNKQASKVFFILAVLYLIIGFGLCFGMMNIY